MKPDYSRYDAILLDLDGTLCHDDHPVPGAVEFVARLHAAGKVVGVISNSGSGPLRVQMRLHAMNIEIDAARIYTAAAHAADTVLETWSPERLGGRRARAFNVATESIHEMLDGRVDWVQHAGEPCDCVLVASPTSGRYTEAAWRTALHLARDGADIVALCADRVFPSRRGLEFGAGAAAALLAYAANREPVFCGKPQPAFFLHVCQRLGVAPGRCLLVGDNLESDIAGGRRVGMDGALVLTGVTRRRDAVHLPEAQRPVTVADDLIALMPPRPDAPRPDASPR